MAVARRRCAWQSNRMLTNVALDGRRGSAADEGAPHHCAELRGACVLSLTGFRGAPAREDGTVEGGDGAKSIARPEHGGSRLPGAVHAHSAAIDTEREDGLENGRVMVGGMMQMESPFANTPAADRAHIDALADDIALCAARLHCVEHELLTNIRRFDELKGWARHGSRSAAEWLSWRIGVGRVAAREKVRVAAALGTLPKIDAAFARGELSYCKVRAMTRMADADNEELLLAQARGTTGAELERISSGFRKVTGGPPTDEERRYVRRRFMQDGTVQIEMRLLPDEAERVWQALSEQRRALASRGASAVEADGSRNVSAEAPTMADAAVAMAERALADTSAHDNSGADRRLLFIHLSERRLSQTTGKTANEPWSAELQDGTTIHGESLLRLACDSGLLIAKTDAKGPVLGPHIDLGRRRRTVSPALMRALRLRDRGCRFPGCNQRAFVDAHHIEHWAHGGATSADNLTLLCGRHHLAVHEGGFRVTRGEEGEPVFFDPDGALIPPIAPMPPSPSRADVARRLAARGQRVQAHTTQPHGRGWSVDLRGCVGALCTRRVAVEAGRQTPPSTADSFAPPDARSTTSES